MAGSRSFTFLGTGTSVGVPMVGCDCAVCRSSHPKNHRFRCSGLVRTPQGNILIDTGPELRLQLLRERVPIVHAVLYTHYHADHLYGLDDLRLFPRQLGHPLPVYCTAEVEDVVRRAFAYAFQPEVEHLPPGSIPKLVFRRIGTAPFEVLGQRVTPVPLEHGRFKVLGFRFGDMAYCTDVNAIPDESWPLLEGLRVLTLDALRHKPHPTHFSLEEALDVIDRVAPEKAYLTHIAHEIDHDAVSRTLPRGVELAYDGLKFEF
jgi:phosphoribosyl 1,2-cyclic phosphate phosphodiesterase